MGARNRVRIELSYRPTCAGRIVSLESIFLHFFGGLECVGHSSYLCRPFCIFERCLDSNPESFRSKQARYQLSHPSPSILGLLKSLKILADFKLAQLRPGLFFYFLKMSGDKSGRWQNKQISYFLFLTA
jgi:hypothetical protein